MSTHEQVRAVLERRIHRDGEVFISYPSFDGVVERLTKPGLRFYLGIDATSPHLHIGHTVALLLLRDLTQLGHEVIVLLGDFTSRIGDPTDKKATRTAQSTEEVEVHMKTYLNQVEKILRPGTFTVRRNSEWLDAMTFTSVAELASRVTVQQMLSRDMFQERIKQEKPIYVSEFLYPLMQGYDSVAMEIDGEVGGSDQIFNMLVGRDLSRELLEKDKMVLPVRLIVDASSGKKISKSEGGFIALDDDPAVIFEKVSRSIPNDMVKLVFELATDVPLAEIEARAEKVEQEGDWRAYNLELAETLVRMYYDKETAERARAEYEAIVKGSIPDSIRTVQVSVTGEAPLTHILSEALNVSRSEAKRLVDQGGVTRNGDPVTDALKPTHVKNGDVFRVGSHQPFRIEVGT